MLESVWWKLRIGGQTLNPPQGFGFRVNSQNGPLSLCNSHMSYSLNSLKGIIKGTTIGFFKGDTRGWTMVPMDSTLQAFINTLS